jgi:hypothetical protein
MQRGQSYRMMFLGFFGTWWTLIGCWGYYGASIPIIAVAVITGLSITMTGWALNSEPSSAQHSPTARDHQGQEVFRWINVAQWVGIALLIVVLNVISRTEWIVPGILLIVGVHFLPLARLFDSRLNAITGIVLVTLALASPLFTDGGPQSPTVPLLAGVMIWMSALVSLAGFARQARTARCSPWMR